MTAKGKRGLTRLAFLLIKWVWILYCVSLLVGVLTALRPSDPIMQFHLAGVLQITMFFLSFPVGIVLVLATWPPAWLLRWLLWQLGVGVALGPYWSLTFIWIAYFVGGYLQWFVLVPYL